MAIDQDEAVMREETALIRKGADTYTSSHYRISYNRVERQFWLNAASYNVRSALLSKTSLEWRNLHIANLSQDLARADPDVDVSTKFASPEIEHRLDIQISAPVVLQEHQEIGFISERGTATFRGQFVLEVLIGPHGCSSIRQINPSSEVSDEPVYVSIFVSEDEMKWLRSELHRCPGAGLAVFVSARVFQEDPERGLTLGHRRFFIEQGGISRITQASVHITEPEQREPARAAPLQMSIFEPSDELIEDVTGTPAISPFSDDIWHADGASGAREAAKVRRPLVMYLIIALQLLVILVLLFRR